MFQVILPGDTTSASRNDEAACHRICRVRHRRRRIRARLAQEAYSSRWVCTLKCSSADDFLQSQRPDIACCLVLDVRLPGLSGLEFQSELAKAGTDLPIIFMTGHGDIPMTVQAMKAGAVEFLTKPCRDQELLDAVRLAIEAPSGEAQGGKASCRSAGAICLADRPRKGGHRPRYRRPLNKQIAAEMDISEVTVKMHRGNIMRKMQARSLADLVRMADLLGVGRRQADSNLDQSTLSFGHPKRHLSHRD